MILRELLNLCIDEQHVTILENDVALVEHKQVKALTWKTIDKIASRDVVGIKTESVSKNKAPTLVIVISPKSDSISFESYKVEDTQATIYTPGIIYCTKDNYCTIDNNTEDSAATTTLKTSINNDEEEISQVGFIHYCTICGRPFNTYDPLQEVCDSCSSQFSNDIDDTGVSE